MEFFKNPCSHMQFSQQSLLWMYLHVLPYKLNKTRVRTIEVIKFGSPNKMLEKQHEVTHRSTTHMDTGPPVVISKALPMKRLYYKVLSLFLTSKRNFRKILILTEIVLWNGNGNKTKLQLHINFHT